MMKLLLLTSFVMIMSGCASTPYDQRLENNYIYQCSLKLIVDAQRRISGEDAAKICTAAYQAEKDKPGSEVTSPSAAATATATATPSATPEAVASATPAPTATPKKSLVDLDEVKPEPTPAE